MATNFPNSVDNFPTHTDNNNEKIQAAHLNNVQDGLKATQQEVFNTKNNTGTLANLNTTDKTNVVNAVNEVNSKVGTLSSLSTSDKTSIINALNEIYKNDLSLYNKTKTGKDANGIYTTIDYKRADNTLFMKSVLSNANGSGYYQTKTETFYATNGTTVIKTDTWTIAYDSDGNVTSEVKS